MTNIFKLLSIFKKENLRNLEDYKFQKPIGVGIHDATLYSKDDQNQGTVEWVIKHESDADIIAEYITGKIFRKLMKQLVPSTKLVRDSKEKKVTIASKLISNFETLKDFSLKHTNKDEYPPIIEFEEIVAYSIFLGDNDFHQKNIGISNGHYYKIDHGNGLNIKNAVFQNNSPSAMLQNAIDKYNYDYKIFLTNDFITQLKTIANLDLGIIDPVLDISLVNLNKYFKGKIYPESVQRFTSSNVKHFSDLKKEIHKALQTRQRDILSLSDTLQILKYIQEENYYSLYNMLTLKPQLVFENITWIYDPKSINEEKAKIFQNKMNLIEYLSNKGLYGKAKYEKIIGEIRDIMVKTLTQEISNIVDHVVKGSSYSADSLVKMLNKYNVHLKFKEYDVLLTEIGNISLEYKKHIISQDSLKNKINALTTKILEHKYNDDIFRLYHVNQQHSSMNTTSTSITSHKKSSTPSSPYIMCFRDKAETRINENYLV